MILNPGRRLTDFIIFIRYKASFPLECFATLASLAFCDDATLRTKTECELPCQCRRHVPWSLVLVSRALILCFSWVVSCPFCYACKMKHSLPRVLFCRVSSAPRTVTPSPEPVGIIVARLVLELASMFSIVGRLLVMMGLGTFHRTSVLVLL